MSEQVLIKIAPKPQAGTNKTPVHASKGEVSGENQREFGRVLSNEVQQQDSQQKSVVAKTSTAASEVTKEAAELALPEDGKVLPVDPGTLELAVEASDELATTALATDAELSTEVLPEADEATVLAAPVGVVSEVVETATEVSLVKGEKATAPTTGLTPADTVAKLTSGITAVAGEAVDDTAQAVASQLRKSDSLDGNVIALASRESSEKTALQANKVIEQFTDAGARPSAQPTHLAPLSGISPVNTTSTATSSATGLQQVSIEVPVQHQQWQRAFAERVVWSVGNNQSVQVRVNPAELGPIDIQVNMTKEQTNITFNTTHAMTRDTIESALPRLREMLASEGLSLGDVDVRHQDTTQGQTASQEQEGKSGNATGLANQESAEEQGEVLLHPVMLSERSVDYYI